MRTPLLTLLLATAGCTAAAEPRPEPGPEPLPVETLEVRPDDGYAVRRRFTGVVRSRRASELAFERPGVLVDIRVDEGDAVDPGQLIARLDTSQLKARRRELVAALREAEAQVELSDVTAARLEELAEAQFTSRQAHDEARFGLAARRASADRLRAAIEAIDVDLRKSRLIAPFRGAVARRLVDEGEVVTAGTPVLRLLDRGRPEAVVGVPARLAADLTVGSVHSLQREGRRLEGLLTAIVDDVDPSTRTRALVFELEANAGVTDGELVELELTRRVPARGFWIPLDALTEGLRGSWTVYAVSPELRVVSAAVEVLHLDDERVFVRGTLEPGDAVLVSGLHRVVPGQPVAVVAPASEESPR